MKFRFESILKVHKEQENLMQKELGIINSHLRNQTDRLRFMENLAEQRKMELNQKTGEEINIDKLVLYNNFFTGVNLEKKRQEMVISEISSKLHLKKENLVQAMRKRRTMEILKERDFASSKKSKLKKEIEIMDETGTNLWRLNA